ncbi:MAG TPA: hypothetical protein DCQ92_03055 [Verrucomicrobia subdivision 3 bacterium]|nr:hypothetical protein [Limisphaerales bacterium]
MARKLRVEYPGAICHVLNRGDRREPIFWDNADRQRFVEAMLAQKQPRKLSGECAYRNRPLSDAQKASGSASSAELPARSEPMDRRESNRQKSRLRARIEHVFGYLGQSMKGFYLRFHWAAAQRGGQRVDQPDLQPGPLRTDGVVEAAA